MRRSTLLEMAVLAGGVAGCYRITYQTGSPVAPGPPFEEVHTNGIAGLVEFSRPVPINVICPEGFSMVRSETTPRDTVIDLALTLVAMCWTVQPHTVTVWCRSGQAFRLDLDPEGLVTAAEAVTAP
jgi:hypothetical protein